MPTVPAVPGDRISRIATRVSTIELLFDLVFVFTISRVAEIVVHHPDWTGVGQAAVVLALVWWMVDAYAWLTNQTAPDTTFVRLALIAAMAGFLVLALAVPEAFGATGVLFGAAWIAVAVIHAALFIQRGGRGAAGRMLVVGPANVLVGVLLICSGFVEGPIDWVLFTLPFVAFLGSALLSARGGFDPGVSHMVERHGLLMIIAFGESIISIGVTASAHELDAALLAGIVLAVGVVAALWWCYFAGDDRRAEEAMSAADPRRRTGLALTAFYLEHLAMIFGLVLLAAGLHDLLAEPTHAVPLPAALLTGGGAGLYLLADASYRTTLRLGPAGWRALGAAAATATAWAGVAGSGLLQLALLVAVVVALLALERAGARRTVRDRSTAADTAGAVG
ncbi:low temperature requirement protein A [Agromyces sp. MMS24-JH15]|uniref:low temperature requirement protein A n=1 Tax=Agromyces sp. MMS24-JH15 TaxID=3243765 RepID=UPI0037499CC1